MPADERVCVLGLGNMGAALARAISGAGHPLTVWNRTEAKAQAVAAATGAAVASSPAEAVGSSDIIVLCLAEHGMTTEILDGTDLPGRCIVQLTAGTATESRALDDWVTARGASFVEGQITVYPEAIGTEASRILYAGAPSALKRIRPVSDALGGAVILGDEIGTVSGLSAAIRTYYVVTSVTTVLAVEMARRHGVSVAAALEEIDRQHPIVMDGVRSSVSEDGPTTATTDKVTIERYAAGAAALADLARELHLEPSVLAAAQQALEGAVDMGYGTAPIGHLLSALDSDSA